MFGYQRGSSPHRTEGVLRSSWKHVWRWGATVCCGLFVVVFACSGLGGGSELDVVAELFELPNEEPSSSFWLIAAC